MASLRSLSKLALLLALSAFPASAQRADSIPSVGMAGAITERFSPLPALKAEAWENPALIQWHYRTGLSEVGGGAVVNTTDRYGEFAARSYLKLGRITIDANASYRNGARHDLKVCENADLDKVYPYLTYDTVGGNQDMERYIFGGTVGVQVGDRWSVGGTLAYDAGLLYRNRDPRPRTVTGDLKATAGGAFRVTPGHTLGLALGYGKYKQTCEISFMSELGASKLYHLTGLGSHYNRFAGRGSSTFYSGNSFGASLTLLPAEGGVYASVAVGTESQRQILEDLNNLPMSRISGRRLSVTAGWMWRHAGVEAYADMTRRHGYENIFGDAASDQYPQIGSLCMHLLNRDLYGVRAAGELTAGRLTLAFSGDVGYMRYSEQYRDPAKSLRLATLTPSAECKALFRVSEGLLLHASARYGLSAPVGTSTISLGTTSGSGTEGFTAILEEGFRKAASTQHEADARLGADIPICSGRYAIGIDTSWSRRTFTGDTFTASAAFKF